MRARMLCRKSRKTRGSTSAGSKHRCYLYEKDEKLCCSAFETMQRDRAPALLHTLGMGKCPAAEDWFAFVQSLRKGTCVANRNFYGVFDR